MPEVLPEYGWDSVMDVNAKGISFWTQKCGSPQRTNAFSKDPVRVIAIGSMDGSKTPGFDDVSDGPSKAAVDPRAHLTAALKVQKNISDNEVASGPCFSRMLSEGVGFGRQVEGAAWDSVGRRNPSGSVCRQEDIAGLTYCLSSRTEAFTVGETITCAGGSVAGAPNDSLRYKERRARKAGEKGRLEGLVID